MAFWEEPAKYFQIVSDFLTDAGLKGSVDGLGMMARLLYTVSELIQF
jgi:hypothetical protein